MGENPAQVFGFEQDVLFRVQKDYEELNEFILGSKNEITLSNIKKDSKIIFPI